MAKQWFAYNHLAKISFVERGRRPQKDFRGEFFDSWAEAAEMVNKQAIARLRAARAEVTAAERHMRKVNSMKAPNAKGEGPGAASCARSISTDGLCGKR